MADPFQMLKLKSTVEGLKPHDRDILDRGHLQTTYKIREFAGSFKDGAQAG